MRIGALTFLPLQEMTQALLFSIVFSNNELSTLTFSNGIHFGVAQKTSWTLWNDTIAKLYFQRRPLAAVRCALCPTVVLIWTPAFWLVLLVHLHVMCWRIIIYKIWIVCTSTFCIISYLLFFGGSFCKLSYILVSIK